jgi:hypothetical protein
MRAAEKSKFLSLIQLAAAFATPEQVLTGADLGSLDGRRNRRFPHHIGRAGPDDDPACRASASASCFESKRLQPA